MKEKNLAYYLTHPHEAGNIPEADLKSWEAAYPYSFGVRWLRARKSVDGLSPGASGDISRAAAFANNLPFLHYKLMDQPAEDLDLSNFEETPSPEAKDDEEIKEATVQKKLEDKKEQEEPREGKRLKKVIKFIKKDQSKSAESTSISKEGEEAPDTTPIESKKEDKERLEVESKSKVKPKSEKKDKVEDIPPTSEAEIPQEKQKTSIQKTKEKMVREGLEKEKKEFTSFTQWLLTLEGIERPESGKTAKKKKKKKSKKTKASSKSKRKKNRLEKLITNSVAEKDEAISETYAQLLERQGYSDKAEEVYRKLMLKFPEKSDYFAARIENLDKN